MATDTSGNQRVDRAWGQNPMQPNDDRAGSVTNFGGTSGTTEIQYETAVVTAKTQPVETKTHPVDAGNLSKPNDNNLSSATSTWGVLGTEEQRRKENSGMNNYYCYYNYYYCHYYYFDYFYYYYFY